MPPGSVEELNRSFTAWVESVYHRARHSETGQPPLERFHTAGPAPTPPTEAVLREAFLWSEKRTVSKTATFGMHGNDYEVDTELARQQVELVFDPLDLTELEVRLGGRTSRVGGPAAIRRHVHPKARAEPDLERPATGIDYLGLVAARRERELAAADRLPQPAADRRRERRGDERMSIDRLRAIGGSRGRRSPRSWRRRCCLTQAHTSRRSRGSAGSCGSGRSALSAVRSAPAKPSPPGRRPPGLDPSRHTVIYLPNPVIGPRGLHAEIVRALGDTPGFTPRR